MLLESHESEFSGFVRVDDSECVRNDLAFDLKIDRAVSRKRRTVVDLKQHWLQFFSKNYIKTQQLEARLVIRILRKMYFVRLAKIRLDRTNSFDYNRFDFLPDCSSVDFEVSFKFFEKILNASFVR